MWIFAITGSAIRVAHAAVESARAVVVIVYEHRAPGDGACAAVGATRTATVRLAAPLADRAVLELPHGTPVVTKTA